MINEMIFSMLHNIIVCCTYQMSFASMHSLYFPILFSYNKLLCILLYLLGQQFVKYLSCDLNVKMKTKMPFIANSAYLLLLSFVNSYPFLSK